MPDGNVLPHRLYVYDFAAVDGLEVGGQHVNVHLAVDGHAVYGFGLQVAQHAAPEGHHLLHELGAEFAQGQ